VRTGFFPDLFSGSEILLIRFSSKLRSQEIAAWRKNRDCLARAPAYETIEKWPAGPHLITSGTPERNFQMLPDLCN
jgi:hypothetical protein